MKKLLALMLTMIVGTSPLFAQSHYEKSIVDRTKEFLMVNNTEKTFRMPPWMERNQFNFLMSNGHRLSFYFTNTQQVSEMVDVDSLLKMVWANLQAFSEGFPKPLVNRRIDYNIDQNDHRVRLQEYQPTSQVFRLKVNDTVQLKIEQDTLSIRLFTKVPSKVFGTAYQPYYIVFLLNNITDLPTLPEEEIEWIVETLKSDAMDLVGKKIRSNFVKMDYSTLSRNRFSSSIHQNKRTEFIPYAQGSFQYVRGGWAPSVGLGFEYNWRQYNLQTSYFRLMWEPYFFFSRTTDKRTELDRADFLSLIYGERLVKEFGSRELRYAVHFSVGYAVRSEGNWFEKNTFKFSFPGVEYRNVMLYPEFNAHKFFQDVSPSLKLVVNME